MIATVPDTTPVIVGVGQSIARWRPEDGAESAPSPVGMAAIAARHALADASSISTGNIDTLSLVRTMADSLPATAYPLGAPVNAPGTLAHTLGMKPDRLVYAGVGGDTPQSLVNEMAERIYNGEATTVLIAGGEATCTMKTARRAGVALDWNAPTTDIYEDRGYGPALLADYEMQHGLGIPDQVYALFEEAWRRKNGLSQQQHRALIADLFAPFSEIAAKNPHAMFRQPRSSDFLKKRSQENYDISSPYFKWHVAQDAVNQGAAVIMTSVKKARRMAIPESKWIYLHSYAEMRDHFVSERPDLSKSVTMQLVLDKVLQNSHLMSNDIAHIDVYSCFPCAVIFAAEALGLDWRKRPLTITGGLPFFGAPGNNYSMHAIATMVERLRTDRDQYGLVLANGGYLSKQAAGIYSALSKPNWQPISGAELHKAEHKKVANPMMLAISGSDFQAKIIAHTVSYYKTRPLSGFALCENEHGRCLAKVRSGDAERLTHIAAQKDLETVEITTENGMNFLNLPP